MEQLKATISAALIIAFFGYCVSFIYDFISKAIKKYNPVCHAWAVVFFQNGSKAYFESRFVTKKTKYNSAYCLKKEAEKIVIDKICEVNDDIKEIVFLTKDDYEKQLEFFRKEYDVASIYGKVKED